MAGSGARQLWQQDPGLVALDPDTVTLFSFDLFDTLLIRLDCTHDDVFVEVGRRAARDGYLDRRISPDIFARMRVAAGRRAEAECGAAYTISDIYRRMPVNSATVETWVAYEIAVEADSLRVDPYINSFICHLAAIGKPVIAVSEMYLAADVLASLIRRAGGEPDVFQQIYVSCDFGASKRDGGLFRRVLQNYPEIPAGRICHIGDDPIADDVIPRKLGLQTHPYDFSMNFAALPAREAEFCGYFAKPREQSARRLAARQLRTLTGDRRFWREFGATILGPVLVGYAGYVIETCRHLGILRIAALMREGRLLAKLLAAYADRREYRMEIATLPVSRLAMARTESQVWDRKMLRDALHQRPHLRLGDILAQVPNLSPPPALAAFADHHIEELANLAISGTTGQPNASVLDALSEWFRQPDVTAATALAAEQARVDTLRFLEQAFAGAPAVALVDLGARATTAAAIHRLSEVRERTDITAFLLYAIDAVTERTESGLPVMIYAGADSPALAAASLMYRTPYVFERLLTGLDDCTVGYTMNADNTVTPLTTPTAAGDDERAWIAEAEAGVMLYWECWLRLNGDGAEAPPGFAGQGSGEVGDIVLLPWLRVLLAPTPEEAERLGALGYDYNDGSSWVRPICDPGAVASVRPVLAEAGAVTAKLLGIRPQVAPWPVGAATIADAGALRRHRDAIAVVSGHAPLCRELVDRVGRSGATAVIIFAAGGAGGMGSACVQAAREAGIEVAAYIDHLPQTVGDEFLGIPVVQPAALDRFVGIPIAVATLGYHSAMTAVLESCGAMVGRRIFSFNEPTKAHPD